MMLIHDLNHGLEAKADLFLIPTLLRKKLMTTWLAVKHWQLLPPPPPPPFFSLSHCLGKCGIFIIIDLTSDTWNVLDHNLEQIFTSLSQILHVMRTAARNCEQCHLILLYQGLLLNVTEYVLVVPTLSHKQRKRLERIQIEAMCIIVGCTRNTTSAFL